MWVDAQATTLRQLRQQLASALVPADQLDRSVIPVSFDERAQHQLERGSVVQVVGQIGEGRVSVLWALARAITAQQEWVAVVDTDQSGKPSPHRFAAAGQSPSWGWVAAAEAGVALDRVALVRHVTPSAWPTVIDMICSGITMVIGSVPSDVSPSVARRLENRVREQKAILVVDEGWKGRVGQRFTASGTRWEGLGPGTGLLRQRTLKVEVADRHRRSESVVFAHAS